MNQTVGIILGLLIVAIAAWIMFESRKRKWYKVYMANNDVRLLYRDFKERWWRTSDRYMRFKDEYGKEITFPANAHWILMWEEVYPEEITAVKDEIRRMKEDWAKQDKELAS